MDKRLMILTRIGQLDQKIEKLEGKKEELIIHYEAIKGKAF